MADKILVEYEDLVRLNRYAERYDKADPALMTRIHRLITEEEKPLIDCPHWERGKITKRKGCTACAATAEKAAGVTIRGKENRCGAGVPGTVPSWAGEDQVDPCPCVRRVNHNGEHRCAHENKENP